MCLLLLRLPREMHLFRPTSNVPRLPSFLKLLQNPHVRLTFDKVHKPLRLPREKTSERALFRHLNFETWCALYILTWKCASGHNGVQFFISHLASWLRTRRFSEPTFRPSGASNHWKNTEFRDFPTFSRTCIFLLLTLSLLWSSLFCPSLLWLFPPLLFHLSILSEFWLLNFLRREHDNSYDCSDYCHHSNIRYNPSSSKGLLRQNLGHVLWGRCLIRKDFDLQEDNITI